LHGSDIDCRDGVVYVYLESVIVKALKEEIKFLPDYTIEAVSKYFNIRKEEMACW